MVSTTLIVVLVASFIFGFVVIGWGARRLYGESGQDPNAKTAGRQSKGAQEER